MVKVYWKGKIGDFFGDIGRIVAKWEIFCNSVAF